MEQSRQQMYFQSNCRYWCNYELSKDSQGVKEAANVTKKLEQAVSRSLSHLKLLTQHDQDRAELVQPRRAVLLRPDVVSAGERWLLHIYSFVHLLVTLA